MKNKKSILSNVLLIIAIVVFCISGYKLYGIFSEYRKGEKEYAALKKEVIQIESVPDTEETGASENVEKKVVIDFDALLRINSETVAWLRFDEPEQINYPLVQAGDNDKYLHKTFEGKSNAAGTIFVDADNAGDFSDKNTFIYGHNMKNGSMFGQLRKYKSRGFCKDYPYFYIHTPDGRVSTYQVFAVCVVDAASECYNKWYNSEQEFLTYIQHVKKIARYTVDVPIDDNSQIVSLSTCTNVTEDERLLVQGVKISEAMQGRIQ